MGDVQPDWLSLRAALEKTVQVTREDRRGFLGTTVEGIEVLVEHSRGATVDWLVLRTPICAQKEMDPELVLERNARLAFAAMVLSNGTYWLRVAVPFDSGELADLARLVALLIDGARSLWPNRLAPQPCAGDVFQHYTT